MHEVCHSMIKWRLNLIAGWANAEIPLMNNWA